MDAKIQWERGVPQVRLKGGLDISSEHGLKQLVAALERDGVDTVRIDLAEVDFIDSRGLGALLAICKEWSKRSRTVEFLGPTTPAVQRVLDVSRVDDELSFADRPSA